MYRRLLALMSTFSDSQATCLRVNLLISISVGLTTQFYPKFYRKLNHINVSPSSPASPSSQIKSSLRLALWKCTSGSQKSMTFFLRHTFCLSNTRNLSLNLISMLESWTVVPQKSHLKQQKHSLLSQKTCARAKGSTWSRTQQTWTTLKTAWHKSTSQILSL